MDDTPYCLICRDKLINSEQSYNTFSKKEGKFINRICQKSILNHSFWFIADKKINKIDLLQFSLPLTSRYVRVDFVNKSSRISCYKNNVPHHIELDRLLTPDFPALDKLRVMVSTLVIFS